MTKTSEKALPVENQTWSRNARGANVTKTNSAESCLIHRVLNGESECFYELVRPYERAIFLAALSLVRNEADAEDIVQEAVLKAFKGLHSFRQEAKFSTWLIQITLNEAKMKLRRIAAIFMNRWTRASAPRMATMFRKTSPTGEKYHQKRWNRKSFARHLLKLWIHSLKNIVPCSYCGTCRQLSIAETVQALGISEASVKTRLSRARLKMRDALATSFRCVSQAQVKSGTRLSVNQRTLGFRA